MITLFPCLLFFFFTSSSTFLSCSQTLFCLSKPTLDSVYVCMPQKFYPYHHLFLGLSVESRMVTKTLLCDIGLIRTITRALTAALYLRLKYPFIHNCRIMSLKCYCNITVIIIIFSFIVNVMILLLLLLL